MVVLVVVVELVVVGAKVVVGARVVVAELRSTLGATIGAADVLADQAMANVVTAIAPNAIGSPMAPTVLKILIFAIRISNPVQFRPLDVSTSVTIALRMSRNCNGLM
jgi:hypothetical protein